MIVTIEGILEEANPLSATIETNGIGYLVNIPLTVSCKLPAIGGKVKLYTHAIYREDKQDLYGFSTKEERDFFKLIVEKVSGVGPKTALNLMSKLSITILQDAIAMKDSDVLAKCHGIGKKSAERIIIELSGKDINLISRSRNLPGITGKSALSSNINDAISALLSLGYKLPDAEKAISKAIERIGESATTEALIRSALSS